MRLLREPLVHFILIGLALFGLDAAVSGDTAPPADDARTIRVTTEVQDELLTAFRSEFGRDPEPEEVDAQVQRWATDEALLREALALGLDDNDPIIRRRLVQNMRFLLDSTEPVEPADDAEIDAWLSENLPAPEARARQDYTQVFVDAQRHEDPVAVALELSTSLVQGAEPEQLGDPFIRGRTFRAAGRAEIARVFGDEAAEVIAGLPVDQWSGPVQSPYGVHLFRVSHRSVPSADGTQAEREAAARAIERERSLRAEDQATDEIVARYTIVRE